MIDCGHPPPDEGKGEQNEICDSGAVNNSQLKPKA